EHPVGGERGAAVRVAVADVDERAAGRQAAALADLAADRADGVVRPEHAPAVRARVDAVRDDVDGDPLAGEERLDRLVEPAREDERPEALDERAEARAHLGR